MTEERPEARAQFHCRDCGLAFDSLRIFLDHLSYLSGNAGVSPDAGGSR